jgi:hypothetical protein
MVSVFRRPTNPVALAVPPALESWDAADHPSQARLAAFLDRVETVAAPDVADVAGRVAFELVVGFDAAVPLDSGGRDLDNYLYPVARRLGPLRLAAAFGRKAHGPSTLAVGPAEAEPAVAPPQFTTRLTSSYDRPAWKQTLLDRLAAAGCRPLPAGPVHFDIAISTGPGRNWTNLWKPSLDSLGPLLGYDPAWPFDPHDDRIVALGLHHTLDAHLGHDVTLQFWWSPSAT